MFVFRKFRSHKVYWIIFCRGKKSDKQPWRKERIIAEQKERKQENQNESTQLWVLFLQENYLKFQMPELRRGKSESSLFSPLTVLITSRIPTQQKRLYSKPSLSNTQNNEPRNEPMIMGLFLLGIAIYFVFLRNICCGFERLLRKGFLFFFPKVIQSQQNLYSILYWNHITFKISIFISNYESTFRLCSFLIFMKGPWTQVPWVIFTLGHWGAGGLRWAKTRVLGDPLTGEWKQSCSPDNHTSNPSITHVGHQNIPRSSHFQCPPSLPQSGPL